MKEEIDRKIDELRDLYEKIDNLHCVFSPESQKDFIIDRIFEHVCDYLRICNDLLESFKKEIEWNDMWIKLNREGLRELAEKISEKITEKIMESKEGENE